MAEDDTKDEEAELAEMLDLSKKKKKKKKKDKKEDSATATTGEDDDAKFAEQRRIIQELETAHGEDEDMYDRKVLFNSIVCIQLI